MSTLPQPKILVVDDERAIREVIGDFLGMEQYEVHAAENGEEAIKRLSETPFDLVLTDLEMPKVNGIELLRHLKTLKQQPLPVIMTGYATVENAVEAMRVGAYDYILKPFKIDEVLHTLRKACEKLHLERENLQLKQAVSLYHVSEAVGLSLPVDTILDVISDTVLQTLPFDWMAIYVGDDNRPMALRKQRSRRPEAAALSASFDWSKVLTSFDSTQVVDHSGEEARAYFQGEAPVEAVLAIPLRARNRIIGGIVGASVVKGHVFHEGERRLLSIVAAQTAAAVDNAALYRNLQQTITSTIEGLVTALEAKDEYTAGHSQRVARWAEIIADLAGLPSEEVARVRQAALLHDIGKIGLNEDSLTKAAKLTPEEFDAFKSHPAMGRRILEPLHFLGPIVTYVHYHHERFDGSGYPEGLQGDAIPLGARILCLADSFEVMSTDRAYRKRLPRDIAFAELERCAGTQFDPALTQAFLDYLRRFDSFKDAMENAEIGAPRELIAMPLA